MAQSNCDVSLIIKEKAENAFWLWRSNEVALPLSLELTFFIKDKISTLKLSNVMAIGLCTIFDSTYFALLTIIMCCCQFFYYFFLFFLHLLKVRQSQTIFSYGRFLQKTNKRFLLYYFEISGWHVFVRFLEEIEDSKKTFWNYLPFRSSEI